MIYKFEDYRDYLKAELQQRKTTNSQYSLRAFAKDINLSPATLSCLLSKKTNLSISTAEQVVQRLKISNTEAQYFKLLVESMLARNTSLKEKYQSEIELKQDLESRRYMNPEGFQLLRPWYHLLILELLELSGFEFSSQEIASKIGISNEEAHQAIRSLSLHGLIENSNGAWKKKKGAAMFRSSVPNGKLRLFHQKMLEKAQQAIFRQGVEERFIGTETFAVHPEQIPEISRKLNKVLIEASAIASRNSTKTDVYHLNISFFSLLGCRSEVTE